MAQGFQNNEDTLEDVSDNINSLEDQEWDNEPYKGFNIRVCLYSKDNSNNDHEQNHKHSRKQWVW